MFRAARILLIISASLFVTDASDVNHLSDTDKARRIVSLLQGISKKLAIERQKEDLVYDEIKRYCRTTDIEDAGTDASEADDSKIVDDEQDTEAETDEPSDDASHEAVQADAAVDASTEEASTAKDSASADEEETADDDSQEGADNSEDTSDAADSKTVDGSQMKSHPAVHIAAVNAPKASHANLRRQAKGEPAVEESIAKFTPDVVDGEDPSTALQSMNSLLTATEGGETSSTRASRAERVAAAKSSPAKVVGELPKQPSKLKDAPAAPKASAGQRTPVKKVERHLAHEERREAPSAVQRTPVKKVATHLPHEERHEAVTKRPVHRKPLVDLHKSQQKDLRREAPAVAVRKTVPKPPRREHAEPVTDAKPTLTLPELPRAPVTKTPMRQLEQDDSASVESLASVVRAAVEPEDQSASTPDRAPSEPSSAAQDSEKAGSALANDEPVASAILSIEDPSVEESDSLAPPAAAKPQSHGHDKKLAQASSEPMKKKKSQAKPQKKEVDPQVAAVQSEFAETADQVARLEKDLTPAEQTMETPTATLRRLDPAFFEKAAAQAQQKENNDVSVAAISEAFGDLGGVIPDIDQQALQLYKSFGGGPTPTEASGSATNSALAFLQVIKAEHHHRELAPVARADLDSAWHALKDVAKDTQNALSMMDLLRSSEDSDPSSSDAHTKKNCALLMKKFEHRRQARATSEKELEKRSQELQRALGASQGGKSKHLRKHK